MTGLPLMSLYVNILVSKVRISVRSESETNEKRLHVILLGQPA